LIDPMVLGEHWDDYDWDERHHSTISFIAGFQ
jgi:hypothetical protein